MTITPEDHALLAAVSLELQHFRQEMTITFRPLSVFRLTALLQLALRHPEVPDELRAVGTDFRAGVDAFFAGCPSVLELLARGDITHSADRERWH